jgi:hypothetical protein
MFGYNDQVQNRLHFERSSQEGFVAYVKASETITVCCGRNMAFFTEPANDTGSPESLKLLTWVDVSNTTFLVFDCMKKLFLLSLVYSPYVWDNCHFFSIFFFCTLISASHGGGRGHFKGIP